MSADGGIVVGADIWFFFSLLLGEDGSGEMHRVRGLFIIPHVEDNSRAKMRDDVGASSTVMYK